MGHGGRHGMCFAGERKRGDVEALRHQRGVARIDQVTRRDVDGIRLRGDKGFHVLRIDRADVHEIVLLDVAARGEQKVAAVGEKVRPPWEFSRRSALRVVIGSGVPPVAGTRWQHRPIDRRRRR
jgi:hypothetical protein